jgi:hypothetical protein
MAKNHLFDTYSFKGFLLRRRLAVEANWRLIAYFGLASLEEDALCNKH